jgi:hypothetical protein
MSEPRKLSEEESQIIATQLSAITEIMYGIDWEYAEAVAQGLDRIATSYDAMAAVHGRWNAEKSTRTAAQAGALRALIFYRRALQAVDKARSAEQIADVLRSDLERLIL